MTETVYWENPNRSSNVSARTRGQPVQPAFAEWPWGRKEGTSGPRGARSQLRSRGEGRGAAQHSAVFWSQPPRGAAECGAAGRRASCGVTVCVVRTGGWWAVKSPSWQEEHHRKCTWAQPLRAPRARTAPWNEGKSSCSKWLVAAVSPPTKITNKNEIGPLNCRTTTKASLIFLMLKLVLYGFQTRSQFHSFLFTHASSPLFYHETEPENRGLGPGTCRNQGWEVHGLRQNRCSQERLLMQRKRCNWVVHVGQVPGVGWDGMGWDAIVHYGA